MSVMHPYDASSQQFPDEPQDTAAGGSWLVFAGLVCLTPAMLLSVLILGGTTMHFLEGDLSIPERIRWPLGMAASLAGVVCSLELLNHSVWRYALYVSGAAAVYCAAAYDAFLVAEINAYTGICGNPVMGFLAFHSACYSVFAGVPLIVLAGLLHKTTGSSAS